MSGKHGQKQVREVRRERWLTHDETDKIARMAFSFDTELKACIARAQAGDRVAQQTLLSQYHCRVWSRQEINDAGRS